MPGSRPPLPTPAAAVAAVAPLLPAQGAPAPGGPTERQRQLMEMQARIQAELDAAGVPNGYPPAQGGSDGAAMAARGAQGIAPAAATRNDVESFYAQQRHGNLPGAPAAPAATFTPLGSGPGALGLGLGMGFGGSRFGLGCMGGSRGIRI